MFAKLCKSERKDLLQALNGGFTCGIYEAGDKWYATAFPDEYICAFIVKPKKK